MSRLFVVGLLGTGLWAAEPPDALRALMKDVMFNYEKSLREIPRWAFERRSTTQKFAKDGSVKEKQTMLLRRERWGDRMVTRPVEVNGKPLSPEQERKQREEIEKRFNSQANSGGAAPSREVQMMREMPNAFQFTLTGRETVRGRETQIYSFDPLPSYQPPSMMLGILRKVKGRIWVDRAEKEMARVEVDVFEHASLGGFLAHIEKDTQMHFDRTRVADGTWLPLASKMRYRGNILLVKGFFEQFESQYSNYIPMSSAPDRQRVGASSQ